MSPFLHGSATNGGLSSGGGPHAPVDDLYSGRMAVIEQNGGSRFREPDYTPLTGDKVPDRMSPMII